MPIPDSHYIVYADDDADDIQFFHEYFSGVSDLPILSFENGRELISFLTTVPPGRFPLIIILDINMPVMSGWETVAYLRNDERYREIPLLMFSTTAAQNEQRNASLYKVDVITKPHNGEMAVSVVQKLKSYIPEQPS
ncbi:MAG TPA: response regulator [Flavisolibacter sp.]|nr:response regulator [Flavisolibacter sp.]